ncbi:MAG: hypothetical protein ACTSXG_01095 [Alphaproteobacteria bacterium]
MDLWINNTVIKTITEKVIEIARQTSIMKHGTGIIKITITNINPNAKMISVRFAMKSYAKGILLMIGGNLSVEDAIYYPFITPDEL